MPVKGFDKLISFQPGIVSQCPILLQIYIKDG